MRKYLLLTSFFVGFLFLNYQTAFSQGCLGADGSSGFGGGVTRFQNGVVCTNLDVPGPPLNGAILQVQVTNVTPGDLIEYRILWNDGSPFTPWTAVPFIGPTTCQVNSVPHFFPTTNTQCEYTPFTFIRVTPGGVGPPIICAPGTFGIAPVYFRWNREGAANSPSSAFAVTSIASPGVVAGLTNVEVCAGVATTVTFQDLTNLNCNTFPGDVTIAGNRNNTRRWRQYEYGGAGANNNIVGGVTVGATPVAAGAGLFGALMTYDGGAFPALVGAPAGVPGGLDGPNTAAAFGVPVSTPTVQTLAITVPATAVVGNTFIVTTHYWNNCNRADQGAASVPYNLTRITVVGQPAAPAAVAVAPVCNGTIRSAMPTFGISGTPGGATVRWYANNTVAVPAVPGTVGALLATTVAGGGGTSSIPFSTGFPGAAGTVMPANNYIVWATYLGASGTITCESLPRAVTRSVRENLDISAQTITPVINVNLCPGSAGHTYTLSMPAAPNPRPVGGNTEYSWTVPAGWSITAGQLSRVITVSVGVGAVAGNIGVVWQYTSVPLCTSGTLNLAVAPLVAPTAAAPTGTNAICEDDVTTFTSVVTGSGITQRWQVDADGAGPGVFVNIPTAGGDPYTNETTNALGINTAGTGTALNGAIYRLVVNGTCGNVTSATRTLTVNQKALITVQPISAPNICINGTKVFTVTATGAGVLSFQWEVDADGAGPGGFVNVPSIGGDPYTGATTASLTINTTGTGTTLNGGRYRVVVNSSLCPTSVTSNQVILTLQGPTTTITNGALVPNCVGSNLNLVATESFLNGSFTSRAWTGTYDETGAPPLIPLTNPQLDLLLTDGIGGSRRTALNPIFNSNGLGVNKQGAYVLTLTTTDDNGCTNAATITVNVGQVTAGILFGPTPGTATNATLNATVCSATDLFLNGAPTGGSGTYTTHTWSVVNPPATPIGTVLTAGSTTATPTFNFTNTTAAVSTFVLRYFVQDNGGCNFITGVGTDITINVNPQPVVANQPIAALCSRTAVGVNFNASTSVAAATYNVTVLNLNGLTVFAGGAAVANGLANTALADDAFLNTTGAQVNVVYTVVPVSAGPASCLGTAFTVTVPVDPQPVVAAQTPAAICSRTPVGVNFSASTSVAAATYNVTALNLNGLTVAAGGAAVANGLLAAALADDAFNNTTAAPVNVVYTVVPVSAVPCQGASFTVTVTVNPEPVVANQPIAALCSRTAVGANFNASTSVAAATYNVTALNLNGLTVFAGGAAVVNGLANTALADDAFTNTTGAQVNVVYTVVPVSAGPASCPGTAFTVTVPVNPEPVVANQPIAALCSKTSVGANFNASTSVAAATYNITALNLNGATVFAGGPAVGTGLLATALADDAFTNVTGATVNVIYTVVPVSAAAASCQGASFTVTVPVTPEPVIAAPFTKTICSGDAVNYTIALTPAGLPATTVFNWPAPTMSDATVQGTIGTNQPVGTTITDVLINLTAAPTTATYNITPSNGACAGTMQPVVITINPVPAVENVIGSASVCVSLNPVVYSITNFNSLDLTTSYSWSIPAGFNRLSGGGGAVPGGGFGPFTAGDGILVLNFPIVAAGSLQVIKRNSFGCQTTAIPLAVNSVATPPILPIDVDPPPYCHNQTGVKFFISAPNPASTYSWSIAAGAGTISGSSVGPIISVNLGVGPFVTVTVTETNTIGCATTFLPETILINPVPDILATPAAQTLCSGTNTNIVLSTPNGTPGTTYTWTVAQSGVAGGANQAVGVAGPINQTLSTLGAAIGTATYTITPTAGGCSGTPVNVVVTVNPLPTVAANPVAPTQCSGVATNIVLSNPNAVAGTAYYWTVVQAGVIGAANGGSFATPVAGPIAQVLTTTAAAQGTATYTIRPVANGCEGPSTIVVVTVDPIPNVAFTPASETLCSGQTTGIALSTPNGVPGAAYFWTVVQAGVVGATNSGTVAAPVAGPISQSLLTTGASPGTATYTVTPVAAGCTGTPQVVVITVNPIPNVAATPPSATICSGATTNIALSTPNLVAGTQYTWTVVQANVAGASNQAVPTAGPISQTLTATTSAPGSATYTVTPIANGCAGTPIDVIVTVNPVPNVLATPAAQTLCSGQSTGIVLSNPNAVAGTQYFWTVVQAGVAGASNQGSLISPVNGPISQALTTTGSVPGTATYTITPVANGCPGTFTTVIVTVNPLPNVIATPAAQTICSGGTTGIALSTTNGVAGTQYFWTVTQSGVAGAFNQGALGAPIAGPIAQLLTTTISATGTATYVITPVANGCPGTSTSVVVTVNPVPVGVPTTMTVCSDIAVGISLNSLVVGGALAASSYDITIISNASGLIASAGAPATGTGFSAAEIADDRWTNTQGIQRDIIYTIVPISGTVPPCSGTPFTLTVHVDPEPVVAAVANQSFCPTDAINIALSSNVGGATINWTNTNTAIGLAASGTGDIIYAAPANNTGANLVGTITVSATNSGCTSAGANVKTFTITIKPTPVMVANSNVVVCSGANVAAITFSANTGGGETFNWTNSNAAIGLAVGGVGNIASFTAGINTTGVPIVATIGVTATRNLCVGPLSNFTITVNPEPVVTAVANQSFCPGDAVNIPLTSNVAGAAISWTNSNTSIGAGATGAGDVIYIAPANNSGVNIVGTITVSGTANGCVSTGGNQKSFTITIKPSPIMAANANITVCSGTAVPLITFSANTGGGETFDWTNDNVAIGLAASGSGNIASYLAPINTTGAAIVGNMSVTGTLNLCTGPARTFIITILPEPVGVPTTITVCSDVAVGVNLSTLISGALGASTYNITAITNVSGLVASAGAPVVGNGFSATVVQDDRWTNTTGIQRDIIYTIVPVSGSVPSCPGAPFDLTVHVDPEPVVAAVVNQSFCPTDAINIPLTSNAAGATINWTNTNPAIGLAASGSGNIVYAAPANNTGGDLVGTISVSATLNGCTSAGANAKTFTITIKPSPIMAANANVAVCSGANVAAISFSANTGGGEVFNWTNSNVAIGLVAAGVGNIASFTAGINTTGVPIVATIGVSGTKNGCTGLVSNFTITVNPEPVVTAVANQSFCPGDAVNIPLTSNVAGAVISWTNSNTSIGLGATGGGDVIYIAPANNSGVNIVGTITVVGTANGCVSTGANIETFTITIKPSPIMAANANITVCSGTAVPLITFSANTGGGETFDWTNDNVAIGLAASGSGNIASYLAPINTTGAAIVGNMSVTGTLNLCTGPARTFIITILPEPVGVPTTITVCSDVAVGVNLSTLISGALGASTYNITAITNVSGLVASAGAPVVGNGFSATVVQDDRWTNTTGIQRDIIYTIVPVSGSVPSCPGAPFDLTVHVDPEPVVAAVVNQSFCPTDAINIPLTSNAAGATINWTNTNPAIGLAASGSGNIVYAAPANNTGGDLVGTISVSATLNGCTSAGANAKTFTITIKPSPIMAANANVAVCSGANVAAISFSANTGGGEVFNWTNSNVAIGLVAAGVGNIASFTAGINTTGVPIVATIGVSGTKNGCTGLVSNFTITVNPEPVVTAVANQSFCPGDAVNIPLTSNVAGAVISWTNSNTSIGLGATGGGDVIYIAPANNSGVNIVGTITVVGTANGCVSTGANIETFTITIKPSPIMNANANITVCSGTMVPLVSFSANTGGGETFDWTNDNVAIGLAASGSGNIASYLAPVNTTGASIVGNMSVTGTLNLCTGPAKTFTITILPQPVGVPTTITVCSDATVGVNLSTLISGALGASTYNITAITNVSGLVASAGAPVVGNGFGATEVQNDKWTNATGVQHDIIYTIVPVSGATCTGAPFDLTVHVDPEPVVAAVANQSFCPTDAVNIPLSSNAVGATLNWTNTNPSIGLAAAGSGNIVYVAPANNTGADLVGTITVSATLNGCTSAGANVKTFTITIKPTPVMAANSNIAVCSGANVPAITFSANTGGGEVFNWTNSNIAIGLAAAGVGNIATFAAAVNTTGAPIVATIGVSATKNGCAGPVSNFTITISPEPVVTAVADVSACALTSIAAINFTTNAGGGETFSWTNSNTAIGLAASGFGSISSYLAPNNVSGVDIVGTITVTATLSGCVSAGANVESFTITIKSLPVGGNDITPIVDSDGVLNYGLQNNVTTLGNTMASTFSWVAANNVNVSGESLAPVGSGFINDVLNNVTNTNQSVLYTVTPTSNGCTGAPFFITVTVRPEPVGIDDAVTVNSDVNINYNLQNNVNSIGNGLPSTFTWITTDNPFLTGESLVLQTTGTITDIVTNVSGVDQVLTYTVTPTGVNGVPGDPFTITVTIRSEPVGSDDVASVCSKGSPNYDLQNNLNTPPGNGQAATFSWFAASNVNVSGESIVPQSGAFITDALRNFTGGDEFVTYTVTPTGTNGCPGNTFQIVVTVRPEPVVSSTLDATQCSGVPYGVLLNTNGVSIGAATYDVTVTSIGAGLTGGRPLGLIGGGGSAANVLMADTWTNNTSVPLNAVYSVVANGTNGCVGDARLVTFTINPSPMLSSPGFPAVCSTNASVNNIVNVVFGTNGTSVAAASFELMNIQFSTGGPFSPVLPVGFTAVGGNAIIGAVGANDLVRNDRFTNGLNIPVTVRYTVRGTSGAGCVSANLDYDVAINPEPVLDPLLNPTPVCSGVISNVTLGVAAGSVGASTYNINSILFPGLTAGGSNTGIGNLKFANAIFNDVYTNTTNGVLTAIYKISPVSAAGCIGPEGTLTLTIQPSPDLSNSLNRTVCINTNGGVVFSTTGASVPAATYNLISVTLQPLLVAAGGNVVPANGVAANYVSADQFSNPTNGPLTVTYRVEPVSGLPCTGPAEDIILTIEPTITATPLSLKPTVCSGSGNGTDLTDIEMISPTNPSAGVITFNYTAVSSIGTGITGFVPALSGLAEGFKITDNLVNSSDNPATVTYSITPVASGAASGAGCMGLPAVIVVTVEPKPKLAIPSFKTICEGVPTAISLTSTTTPSAGTIEFLMVTAVPSSVNITGASANGTVFANGSTLNDVLSNNSTFAETMTYTFRPRYLGGAGCVGDDVITIVSVNPRPIVTPSPQPQICSGDIIDINLVTDVASTVPIWTVTVPAGVTGASAGAGDRIFQILFNNTTGTGPLTVTYHVTPSAAGCAGTVVDIPVIVNPLAKVTGVPTTVTVCHGTALNIPLTSNVTAGVSFAWTVIDSSGGLVGGAVAGSGNVINQVLTNTSGAQATLTYTITPTGPGPGAGCIGQDKIMIVTVSPEITANWLNTPSPDFICFGSTEFLVLNIGGRAPFNFQYNDGTTNFPKNNQPPVVVMQHPLLPPGATTFTLTTVTDGLGCTVPFNVPFVVNVGDTDPSFTIVNPVPVAACSPNEVTFRYNQVAGTIYTWRFGESADSVYTATATVPNMQIKHTYTNLSPSSTLNYPVTLQTSLGLPFPGCIETSPAQTVTIYPNVITNVIPNNSQICSGDLVTFTNSSVGTNGQNWSFRVQGQIPETAMGSTFNMNYTFTNATTANPIIYEVIFRATNGLCPAPDVIMPIEVYRESVAGFMESPSPPPDFINGESLVTFNNTSSIVDPAAFTYDWVFGPDANPATASAAAPGVVQYLSPGPKDITLTVTNILRAQCRTTFTRQITINLPPLLAMFDVNPKFSCFPSKVSVSTDPLVTQITGDIIEWKVVDQNNRTVATSSGVFPEFAIPAPGEYTVFLTTKSSQTGQTATATPVDITVYAQPFASFDARPDVLFVPDTELTIFNFSEDPQDLQFTWDFGDGDILVGPAPPNDVPVPTGTHSGRTGGTFEEPTHFYKIEGLYDLTMYASFDHGNGVVCADTLKQQVQARQGGVTKVPNAFTPNPNGPSGGQPGNGSFNDVFLPIVKGADEFNLQIYDRWGNMLFESNNSQIGWDGYSPEGKLLPSGVYVYKLTVRLSDGQRSTQIGDITMIR